MKSPERPSSNGLSGGLLVRKTYGICRQKPADSPLSACPFLFFLFQIGVAVEAGAVVGDELLAFLVGDFFLFDGLAHSPFEEAPQLFGVVLYVFQHIGHGLAVNGLFDFVAVAVHGDVYGVGVTE